jgi:PPK2 family polyphosphate:nucleotide phosphotransferase
MDRYRIAPGTSVDLADLDPGDSSEFDGDKEAGQAKADELVDRIEELQELMWADHSRRLLIVLQATDTGGKDGTIRHVLDGVNPQGVRVAGFKKPTEPELAHDYLWRVHPHVPGDGEIVVFNRSHYEDVLVVRVHDLVPEERWRKRYDHIRDFEQMLADEGTTIVKFFLHISKDEQKERLQARLDEPDKNWKFDVGDLRERERWDDYQRAFAEAIEHTSTEAAPWYVVPADRKWYRNLVISQILVDTLEGLDLRHPEPDDLDGVVIT